MKHLLIIQHLAKPPQLEKIVVVFREAFYAKCIPEKALHPPYPEHYRMLGPNKTGEY
jgi:hypothetical protein